MTRDAIHMAREELRAYHQGKKDALAGRSVFAPRYSDKRRDEAWLKGMLKQLKNNQRRGTR